MGPESQSIDSLLDFLYVDRDRLQSLSGQLEKSGVLSTTKTLDHESSKSTGSLGIPGTNVSAEGLTVSSIEQLFDAAHTLPLNVLDRLSERGFIHEDIGKTGLGNLFLATGKIRFIDYRILKNCWEPIHNATVQEQQSKGQFLKAPEKASMKNNFKLMESLPHSTELTIHTAGENIWTSIDPACLKVEPATLAFAHGTIIPGSWTMLATLDARPYSEEDAREEAALPMVRDMTVAMATAFEHLRALLGRPYSYYAATPLLVFRNVVPCEQLDPQPLQTA